MVQDIIINGLINGSIYALLAIGFSLIFGVARLVNIAHTAFYMVATYLLYIGLNLLGISAILSLVGSVLTTTILGLICYRLFIKPIREHEAAVLIATIALGMVLQEILLYFFKGHYLGVPPLVSGFITDSRSKGGQPTPGRVGSSLTGISRHLVSSYEDQDRSRDTMHRPG